MHDLTPDHKLRFPMLARFVAPCNHFRKGKPLEVDSSLTGPSSFSD
jgi:hypothetical protein